MENSSLELSSRRPSSLELSSLELSSQRLSSSARPSWRCSSSPASSPLSSSARSSSPPSLQSSSTISWRRPSAMQPFDLSYSKSVRWERLWQLRCTKNNLDEHVAIVTPGATSANRSRPCPGPVGGYGVGGGLSLHPEPAAHA